MVENHGATVTDVIVESDAIINGPMTIALWAANEIKSVMLNPDTSIGTEVFIRYDDATGISQELSYVITSGYILNPELADLV